jgi:hypothetical protein
MPSISAAPARGAAAAVLCLTVLPTVPFRAVAQPPQITASPAHVRLFAPPARAAAFRFDRTDAPIESVAQLYRQRWPAADPRSWRIERQAARDAFDGAALYDRARLARLYAGRDPRVARGPVTENAEVVQVVLLMSPYPEADLRRLNPGTLIMTVAVVK